MEAISLKIRSIITRKIKGFNILQKTPKSEFLYRSLIVFTARLSIAFLNPLSDNVESTPFKNFCKISVI